MLSKFKNLNNRNCSVVIILLVGVSFGFVTLTLFSMESGKVFAQANVSNMLNSTHFEPLNNNTNNNTLYVSGTATGKVSTDLVTISVGVQSTNMTATDALISNSKIVNEIISNLIANGVKENEISTSQYTIQPNYNYSKSGNIINTVGFTVSNILTIQSPNLKNISLWIDSAVSAGANTINGVDFKVSDQLLENVRNTLIEQAIVNAKQKADITAYAIGASIMGIKSISINTDGFSPLPFDEQFMQKAFTSEGSSTPIIPGEQEVTINVQIAYKFR